MVLSSVPFCSELIRDTVNADEGGVLLLHLKIILTPFQILSCPDRSSNHSTFIVSLRFHVCGFFVVLFLVNYSLVDNFARRGFHRHNTTLLRGISRVEHSDVLRGIYRAGLRQISRQIYYVKLVNPSAI